MNSLDFLELAALICCDGNDEEAEKLDLDWEKIQDAMWEKFEIDLDQFVFIAKKLIDYTPIVPSPLTPIKYKGFVHNGYFLVKKQANRNEA